MLHIVTDGGADMPSGWENEYNIHVLPLRVNFGERTYVQGVDFELEGGNFYNLVQQYHMVPKTSLPSPGQIIEFYRSIAQKGDTILSIHIASKLSGTFAAVQMATREIGDEYRIYVFDSLAGSAAMGFMCREARLLERAGKPVQEILRRLEQIRDRLTVVFTLDTLDFARMNGRVSALQGAITSMLKIKPIIVLRDGLLHMGDKVRTRQRALEHVLEFVAGRVDHRPVQVAVVHANDPTSAKQLLESVRSMFNCTEIVTTALSIPVAANLGPGTVGIVAIPVEE